MAVQIQYTRNFQVGRDTHLVYVYGEYTETYGLAYLDERIETYTMRDMHRKLKGRLTKPQRDLLDQLMRERTDGIALSSGEYKSY